METVSFDSAVLGREQTLRVLLPPGYGETPQRDYPVLIMTDGENLFSGTTSFMDLREWMIDETLHRFWIAGLIEEFIVVGVDSLGRTDRGMEYLPWEDIYLSPPIPNPRGKEFPVFLADELIPFLRSRFSIGAGAEHITVGGASYGGLIALYSAIHRPDSIGNVYIESASLYVNDRAVIKELRGIGEIPWNRVVIGVGTHEAVPDCTTSATEDIVADHRVVADIISSTLSQTGNTELLFQVEPCGFHNPESWGRRFQQAVQFLYR